eukprot:scaffold521071_cov19-Prasinocladus_malaysianus.AAC.1
MHGFSTDRIGLTLACRLSPVQLMAAPLVGTDIAPLQVNLERVVRDKNQASNAHLPTQYFNLATCLCCSMATQETRFCLSVHAHYVIWPSVLSSWQTQSLLVTCVSTDDEAIAAFTAADASANFWYDFAYLCCCRQALDELHK